MHDQWVLVDNPAWAGVKPSGLTESSCCDRSHCLTVECGCGEQMHMHESKTKQVPRGSGVASRCLGCGDLLTFPPGYFAKAFAEMRRQGWIR